MFYYKCPKCNTWIPLDIEYVAGNTNIIYVCDCAYSNRIEGEAYYAMATVANIKKITKT